MLHVRTARLVPFLRLIDVGDAARNPHIFRWSSYMNQLSRILSAVDFSEPGRAAFDQALVLSRTHNAELTVVHAIPKEQPFRWHARERIAMIAALREAAEAAGVRLKVSVQHGDPAGVILLHARARRPDLLVLGTNQRTGFERFRLGSVAEAVTLRATQPVLIVPAFAGGRSAVPVTSFDNIVAAVDLGAATSVTVERALSLASNTKGRVTLVHVVQGISPASVSRYTYHFDVPEYQSLVAEDAWRRLQDAIPLNARKAERIHARVVTGDPSTEITRIAADLDADLIVVGVTSRGAIGRRIFGATAARLIRTAGRPVLAVPERTDRRAVPPSETKPLPIAA
jgi:nucleotide-binding universal stress UspA family protein